MPSPRTVAATTGLVALVALTGCAELGQSELHYDRTEDVEIEMIEIAPGSGDVVVRTAPVSNVRIKRLVRYQGAEPGSTYRIDGTVLTVDTNCGTRCSVSYDITAPEGVSVRGENGSGDLSLTDVAQIDVTVGSGSIGVRGASGDVDMETGSGDINVTDLGGAVTLRAGSGSIEGHDLDGGDVTVEVGSGDIFLSLAAPRSVRAHAGSGDIAVSVPDGGYRVSVRTDSGDKAVDMTDDPTARNVLDLSSGSGDIAVSRML